MLCNVTVMPTIRILTASIAINLACLKFILAFYLAIPKPDNVLIPVPYNLLENVQWLMSNPYKMHSTCGTFKTYKGLTEEVKNKK